MRRTLRTLLAAAVHWAGLDTGRTMQILGIVAGAATLWVVDRFATRVFGLDGAARDRSVGGACPVHIDLDGSALEPDSGRIGLALMERLFVYGSLQPGGRNEHVLADVEGEWAPAVLRGKLIEAGWGANLGYPALVIDEDGDDVPGYVLASSKLGDEWARLDEFEGEEYARIVATVSLLSGQRVHAHVYVLRV